MQGHRSVDLPVQTFEFTRGFVRKEGNTCRRKVCKFRVKTKAAGLLHARRQDIEGYPRGLANVIVEFLQVITHGHHELVSVRAIDNTVIVTH